MSHPCLAPDVQSSDMPACLMEMSWLLGSCPPLWRTHWDILFDLIERTYILPITQQVSYCLTSFLVQFACFCRLCQLPPAYAKLQRLVLIWVVSAAPGLMPNSSSSLLCTLLSFGGWSVIRPYRYELVGQCCGSSRLSSPRWLERETKLF